MTLYELKPRFQALLRPLAARLARNGVTANAVTLTAAFGSVLLGLALCRWPEHRALFLLLPVWLFIRMALNAIDGMLAREFGQKSRLGAYLNELCDVVSDAALSLPFCFIAPLRSAEVVVVVLLALIAEYAGVMAPLIGAERRYDGPLGKSDRALVFGALGLWTGLRLPMPDLLHWLMPLMGILLAATIWNRVRRGIAQI
ncbi:CDP-diacylglycerol--glycerol-3-phosphate 3-phosphatidyltransferase [Rhizobiales bacterium GAS113]|nr:CDP-diacylglycerol--glycerol-3-phosphate 3-phosphatidyltransferase [Rhizobiales bacterium GAS113]